MANKRDSAFRDVDLRESLTAALVEHETNDPAANKTDDQILMMESLKNSMLARHLSVTLDDEALPDVADMQENHFLQLEAQDRIQRAKEDALSKHQHNRGLLHHTFADTGQMENISREEWDTEVFGETVEEPTCSKVHRWASILCHLGMFVFCLYANLTITDDSIEADGKTNNESDFNFEVCPELCRPDSTRLFDFKEAATCKRKFTSEFDNIVWRQSTHLDKNCADTCQRHSMKCKPHYPKSDGELHSAAERAGFFCNDTPTRGRPQDRPWERYTVFEHVYDWTSTPAFEWLVGPVYYKQPIFYASKSLTEWEKKDNGSEVISEHWINVPVSSENSFGVAEERATSFWFPWSSVLYLDMDPNLEYKSRHMCDGDCSAFACDIVQQTIPGCEHMMNPDLLQKQQVEEKKCFPKCRDFINPDANTRIFPFEHNKWPLPSGPCMRHSPHYFSPDAEVTPDFWKGGKVPNDDAVCTTDFPTRGIFDTTAKPKIPRDPDDVLIRPLSKSSPKGKAQLQRQAQKLQLAAGLKGVKGDKTMERLLFGGGGFMGNLEGNSVLVAHPRNKTVDGDRHKCNIGDFHDAMKNIETGRDALEKKLLEHVCIKWHKDLVWLRKPRPTARQLCPCEIGEVLDPCQHTDYNEEEGFKRYENATISDNNIRTYKGIPAYSVYWREPLDGQTCTLDSTAHYYHFSGRYSYWLDRIFVLLMNLSMVYTFTIALYNIYVATRRFQPRREHNYYITSVQFFVLLIVLIIDMYLAWCLFFSANVRTTNADTLEYMKIADTAAEWKGFTNELQQILRADHSESFSEKVMTGSRISDLGARIWERYLTRECTQQPSSILNDIVSDITVQNGCVYHDKVYRLGVRDTCKQNHGCGPIEDRETCASVPDCQDQVFDRFSVNNKDLELPESIRDEALPKGCLYITQSPESVNHRRDTIAKRLCKDTPGCTDFKTQRYLAKRETKYPFTAYCYWNPDGTGDKMVEKKHASARAICSCENTCKSVTSRSASSLYCKWSVDKDGVSGDPEQCTDQCEKGWDSFDTPKMCGLQLQLQPMRMNHFVLIYAGMVILLLWLLLRSLVFQFLVMCFYRSKQCENCKCVYTAGSRRPSLCNQCGHVYCPKCLVHERTIMGKIQGEEAGIMADAVLLFFSNPVAFLTSLPEIILRLASKLKRKAVCSTCFATTTTTAMHRLQLHAPRPGEGMQIEIVKTYQKLLDAHYKATNTIMSNLDGEFSDRDGVVERHVDDGDMLHGKGCICFEGSYRIADQHKISRSQMNIRFERHLRRSMGVFWWMSTTAIDPKTHEETTVIMGDLVKEAFLSLFDELNKEELLKTWVGQLFKWIDMNDEYVADVNDEDDKKGNDVLQALRKFKSLSDKMKMRAVRKLTKAGVFRPDFVQLVDQIISQVDNSKTRSENSEINTTPHFLSDGTNFSTDSLSLGSRRSLKSVDMDDPEVGEDGQEMRDTIPVQLENYLCSEAPAGVENDVECTPGEKLATYFWSGMDLEQRGEFRKALAWYSPLALSRPNAIAGPPEADDAHGHAIADAEEKQATKTTDSACAVPCRVVARVAKSNIFGGIEKHYRIAIFEDFIAFLSPEAQVEGQAKDPGSAGMMHIQDMHSLSDHSMREASKAQYTETMLAADNDHVPPDPDHPVVRSMTRTANAIAMEYQNEDKVSRVKRRRQSVTRREGSEENDDPSIISTRLVFDLDEHLCGVITRAEVLRASVTSTDPSGVQLFMREGEAAFGTVKGAQQKNAKLVRFSDDERKNADAQAFASIIEEWRTEGMEPEVEAFPFESSFPVREGINTRLLFGGKDYFEVLCDAIMAAERTIMISSCDFMPELYLKRDERYGPVQDFRLDLLLQSKARQGVLVYILLSPQCQSQRSKKSIMSILNPTTAHNNIIVHRCKAPPSGELRMGQKSLLRHHPERSPTRMPYQQHDLSVVIDNSLAFVGGIDLSLGSYEEWGFPLADPDGKLYPGRCYKNILESHLHLNVNKALNYRNVYFGDESPFTDIGERGWAEPYDTDAWVSDRMMEPRMPSSQVQVMVDGKAALDVAASFVQRWNNGSTRCAAHPFLKRKAIWLMPAIPKWEFPKSVQGMQVQVLRSMSGWSGGARLETSIYRAYLHLIQAAETSIYIESEVLISSLQGQSFVHNRITEALYTRIAKAILQEEDFRVVIVLPIMPLPLDPAVDKLFGSPYFQSKGILFPYSFFNLRTLCHDNGKSLLERLQADFGEKVQVDKYISVLSMQTWAKGGKANHLNPTSDPLNADVFSDGASTQVYAGKMLIVDDKHAVFGSANINDRSMLGHRNSEIALYLKDTQIHQLDDGPDGNSFGKRRPTVGKHVHRFRMQMFNKLLGLPQNDYDTTADFVRSYDRLVSTAVQNTNLLHKAFPLIPHSEYRTFASFTNILEIESHPHEQFLSEKAKHQAKLDSVQGTVIQFPVKFLHLEQNHFIYPDSMSSGVTSDKSIANRYT